MMHWMITLIAFLAGWVIGSHLTDWINHKLAEVQREYIEALKDAIKDQPHD